jgi:predicted helicase
MRETHIKNYLKSVSALYAQGITTEHSFRGALETLLKNMTNLSVVNEAQRIACGAPDLTLLRDGIPAGYVEAKDIGKNLASKDYKNQLDRYKKALENLMVTNYLTFQLFEGENFVTEISIGKIQPNKVDPIPENFGAFVEMVKAFSFYNGKAIKDSKKLAEFMAAKTQLLAQVMEQTLNSESTLHAQLQGFQEALMPTMDNAQFADMYAQTIAYGMFVARLQGNSDSAFTRQQAANLIPKSNPFLRNLFQYIAGYDIDNNIRWIVDSLADMFSYVDMVAIHKEFISKDKDPFLHFYEDFLARYDKNLKNARGAYYTPSAVVRFIVDAVDDILKSDFNLAKGLADSSKVNIKGNEYHKVQILDPATGTGTFLAEVVRNIYRKFGGNAGKWNDYVKEHLIPRLNGFEIMMSPYTMAHLKIEAILQEFGHTAADNQRLQIYLTDSLDSPKQNTPKLPFTQWLSNEATEAQKIKNEAPVMVVLGNPPYSGESVNNGDWIKGLLEQYKKEPQNPSQGIPDTKWLNNDYVKFIRFGQHFIHKNKKGVLAYITDNSFLDSLSFRGMRWSLLNEFDKIYVLNLHGNSLKKEASPDGSKDENVFDIMQGVSINIFVKTGKKSSDKLADIFYFDLFGKRAEKYQYLLDNKINTVHWEKLHPRTLSYFFVPKDFSLQKEYEKGFKIDELFCLNGVGICSKRDEFTIHETKENLISTVKQFVALNDEEARSHFKLGKDTDWALSKAKKDLTSNPDFTKITEISYRPFDVRYTYYSKNKGFNARPVYSVMQHFTKGKNIGLCICRQQSTFDFQHIFVTKNIADMCLVSSQTREAGYVFPLYLYLDDFGKTEKLINMDEAIKNQISETATPEQIFDYIYAVLHSPSYREKYKEFLKIAFPRIPHPATAEYFGKMVAFGKKLRKLHLMENVAPPQNLANFPQTGSNVVENAFTEKSAAYQDNKVWINAAQYFDNVPQAAYKFYIGGYQPAQKWLKDRKGKALSYEDIEHYQKIIFVLNETDKIMKKIALTS